ncbi:hypothetical protein QMP26_41635 (plasmid) [Enterocloster clostridioformis]
MKYTNQIYSGRYYQLKEQSHQELSAARIWLQHQYYRTFISLSLITLFALLIITILSRHLPFRWMNPVTALIPSIAVTVIFTYFVATIRRIHRLKSSAYVQKLLLSNPWVIGEVPNGILISNLDNSDDDSFMQIQLKKYFDELINIENGPTVFGKICSKKDLLKKGIISTSLTGEQLLYVLAICELTIEQYHINNKKFFTSPNPLDAYQQIAHSRGEIT